MQERYLGDSHDFMKYALLRHLAAETEMRLGVNWYLTAPEHVDRPGNNDGEKRHHLSGGVWQSTDRDLFDRISRFATPSARSLANIERFGILPSATCFHGDLISDAVRSEWHRDALLNLAEADLIFLDPDNGFEVPSQTRRTAPKYALYREAADYVQAGKTVIAIQFARQCDPVRRALEVREKLARATGSSAELPVIRARLAPNVLFLTVAQDSQHERLARALHSFTSKCGKAEVID